MRPDPQIPCTCDDPRWEIQLNIGDEVVDTVLVDYADGPEAGEAQANAASDKHMGMYRRACDEAGRDVDSAVIIRCPTCGAAMVMGATDEAFFDAVSQELTRGPD